MEKLYIERFRDIQLLINKSIIKIGKKPEKIKNFTQAQIILYLFNHQDECVYQKDIGTALKINKVSITEHLDYLESEDFVVRIADKKDKRRKQICLSKKSINKMNEFENALKNINEKTINGISKNDLKHFEDILNKMEENLRG